MRASGGNVRAGVTRAGLCLMAWITLAPAAACAEGVPAAGGEPGPETALSGEDGPVVLVTGSTDGLGREVASRIAGTGAHVIVHGRNVERGEEVVRAIEDEGGSARFYRADFGSLAEVRTLAEAILRDYDRLDVLVNNAGIWLQADAGRVLSEDGHELHFQVNYLSGFLLTRMLLPLLVESAPSRVVNVASGAQTPLDFDDVMMERNYSDGRGYGQSKLAQILFTVDLAEELAAEDVVVTALHPATFMDTNMVLSRGAAPRSSVDDGAEAVLNLMTSPDIESGLFFNGLNPTRANAQAYDPDARARLKALSLELTGL